MGCDIHTLLEKKCYDGSCWNNVDYWQYTYDEDSSYKLRLIDFYDDRNYELFSVLADVRNYQDLEYICEPKGMPEDCSKETQDYIDSWGLDGHSHSYFTIKELYDYWLEMPTTIKRNGILIGEILEKFDKTGEEPTEWCRGCSTPEKHEWREWEVEYNPLDRFMNALIDRFCKEFWLFYVDEKEYKTSEKLRKFVDDNGDKFRVVFFFDN